MKTSILKDRPELDLIKRRIEETSGVKPKAPSDFVTLATVISKSDGCFINEHTLMRLWGYVNRYKSIHKSTLDVLSKYLGYPDFGSFLEHEKTLARKESGEIDKFTVNVTELQAGDRLTISWFPDRTTTLLYLGDSQFRIEAVENASWKVGDKFYCLHFTLGEPLYVDNLTTESGECIKSYAVGMISGLTSILGIDRVS